MKVGESVLNEDPYCHVLSQKHRGLLCDRCFVRVDSLKKCVGCGVLWYCNKQCQKRDWGVHKLECKCMKQVSPKIPLDSVRMMMRLIISKVRDLPMNSLWSRKFDDLMTHSEEVRADSVRMEQFAQIAYTLKEYAGSHVTLPSAEEIFNIFCRMVINSFTICDGELQDLGTGLYLSGSMLDHSCQPNAVPSFHGCTLVVNTTEEIPDPSPNKVYISYVDLLSPVSERQQALQEQYYFQCQCKKCLDEEFNDLMVSFCCPVKNCDGAVCLTKGDVFKPCRKCGNKDFSPVLKQGALKVLKDCKGKLEQIGQDREADTGKILDSCKKLLQEINNILHPMNVYKVKVLDRAFDAAVEAEEWEKAIKYAQKTIKPYQTYYPKYCRNLAIQLFKIGKLQLYLQDLEDALKSLEQAQEKLSVTNGTEHEIYKRITLFVNQCREEMRVKLQRS